MIVFINRFTVHDSPEKFEQAFLATSEYMRAQPGFIRHRLVRSQTDPSSYVNIAEWDSAEALQRAIRHNDFQEHVRALRALATSDPVTCTPVLERDPVRR